MPRRPRPLKTKGSEHWLRVMVNQYPHVMNAAISETFCLQEQKIEWLSPCRDDNYTEYYDQAFLDRLGACDLKMPLEEFWPKSGPRWDGLARTGNNTLFLIEAKAHIEESVDFRSKAKDGSLRRIEKRLEEAKHAFRAFRDASWEVPFYQMANRLAHLYYLAEINKKDAYLVFVDFANAPDVEKPASCEQWQGALRLARKCLGIKDSKLAKRVGAIIVDLNMGDGNPTTWATKHF